MGGSAVVPCSLGEARLTLQLSDWPGGVEPVRAMLDRNSARELEREPSAENHTLRLATDLNEEELALSAFVRNALVLLREMAAEGALRLTKRGNLPRATVAAMRAAMSWPGMEAAEIYREGKAFREQDVGELHLLRLLTEMAGLVERRGCWLELTPLGHAMLETGMRGALQALLFRFAFWHADLSRFVGGVPRGLPAKWPQGEMEMGVLLWSLSAIAGEWQNADVLTSLCTVPDNTIPTAHWNPEAMLFAVRILGPLRWFGLVECREPEGLRESRCWRKSALFDRFLSFDVQLPDNRAAGH